ncbi:MAG: hypothetical protein HY314_08305 [Acidobacteria bacterium]|nr:hypothetical protein [Acidobacteriota bacterium]
MVFAGADLPLTLGGGFLTYGVSPVLNLMIIGGLTKVVANHVMAEEPISFRRTWQVIIDHAGQLVGVAAIGWLLLPITLIILGGIGALGVGVLAFVLSAILMGQEASWLVALPIGIIGGIALLVGGLLFLEIYARVVMMPAAVIIERQPVGSAISRGLRLGAKNSPTVLAVLSFEYCLMWSIATALGVPLGIYAAIAGLSLGDSTEQMAVAFNILLQFGNLLSAPVAAVAFALLYFDNRVRKEGLDVEFLAQEIVFPSAPAPVTAASGVGGLR